MLNKTCSPIIEDQLRFSMTNRLHSHTTIGVKIAPQMKYATKYTRATSNHAIGLPMCTRKSYENVVPISAAASQTATGSAQFSNNLFFIERSRRGLALSIRPARFQFMYAATSIGTQVPQTIHADRGIRPATRTCKTTTHHKVSK